jgi:hypothetical protein
MAGCTIFSKIAFVKAYQQIRIAEADVPKAVIATHFCLFELFFMAFALLRSCGSGRHAAAELCLVEACSAALRVLENC